MKRLDMRKIILLATYLVALFWIAEMIFEDTHHDFPAMLMCWGAAMGTLILCWLFNEPDELDGSDEEPDRVNCPWCEQGVRDLKEHVSWCYAFPQPHKYCTVCSRIEDAPPEEPASPPYTMPCPGGSFVV